MATAREPAKTPSTIESSAFGLGVRTGFAVPGLPSRAPAPGAPGVQLEAVSDARLAELWSGAGGDAVWHTVFEDGARYALIPGVAGDHLIEYGPSPAFHLSSDGRALSCAAPERQGPEWRRVLTDTVLWSVALLRGRALLHASAVTGPDGVVAIAAAQGAGKTSLAAQLVLEGWPLVSDDVLAFERSGDRIVAHPGPNLMNLASGAAATPRPEQLGEVLARFREGNTAEAWVRVNSHVDVELSLAAIVLLRRGATDGVRLARVRATAVDVIPHTLAFRRVAGALRRRFEAVGDLVERVPVFSLEAWDDASPGKLAATLREGLAKRV